MSAQAVLRTVWEHGVGKQVTVDAGTRPAAAAPPASRPYGDLAASLPGGDRIARVLQDALGPTRWDDWSHYNDHRPYPSPRAKHAHRLQLWLADGAHEVDEVRSRFATAARAVPVGGGGRPPAGAVATVAVGPAVERIPAGYGRLAEALTRLEVGHVAQAVVTAAGRHGIGVRAAPLADGPGVAVHLLGPQDPIPTAAAGRRCSGLDPRGLAADPRPLPAATLASLLVDAPVADGRLRHRFALHRVTDHADGVWEPGAGGPWLLRAGAAAAAVAPAFRGPPGVVDVGSMNLVWAISAPVARRVRAVADYDRLLFRTGAAAQRLCESAARVGLFCRPARGIEEPDIEAALGLPADEDLLYLLLLGRPRVSGFGYDLTPCPPPPTPGDQP